MVEAVLPALESLGARGSSLQLDTLDVCRHCDWFKAAKGTDQLCWLLVSKRNETERGVRQRN